MASFEGELFLPNILEQFVPNPWGPLPPPPVGDVIVVLDPGERPAVVERWWNSDLGPIGVRVFLGWGTEGPYVEHAAVGLRVPDCPMINIPPKLVRFKLRRPGTPDADRERSDDGPAAGTRGAVSV